MPPRASVAAGGAATPTCTSWPSSTAYRTSTSTSSSGGCCGTSPRSCPASDHSTPTRSWRPLDRRRTSDRTNRDVRFPSLRARKRERDLHAHEVVTATLQEVQHGQRRLLLRVVGRLLGAEP